MSHRILPAAFLALAACTGSEGELGGGVFLYECSTDHDAACGPNRLTQAASVPAVLAVGAPFGLAYESHRDGVPVFLAPASPETAELRGGVGRLLVPGTSTVLARTADG